jgi:hypothetical protein
MRKKTKRRKTKRRKPLLKRAAKAIAKMISDQEEARDRDIAELERAVAKKFKRLMSRRAR